MKRDWKLIVVLAIIPISWLLFPFLTYGQEQGNFLPLVILMVQIVLVITSREIKRLWFIMLNPVVVFLIFYTAKPIFNYARGRPTKMHCSYHSNSPTFDPDQMVYLDIDDDDCDWSGYYFYTSDINNFVTDGLIGIFGNPIKSNPETRQE
jgi:hypothetical protein